eukprot:m.92212 g.92212  ORF g.92212 m.92212 type:complete len:124 (+) comp14657_c3_seq2:2589-2960(+)
MLICTCSCSLGAEEVVEFKRIEPAGWTGRAAYMRDTVEIEDARDAVDLLPAVMESAAAHLRSGSACTRTHAATAVVAAVVTARAAALLAALVAIVGLVRRRAHKPSATGRKKKELKKTESQGK